MNKLLAALSLAVLLATVAATASDAAVVTRSTFHSDFTYFNPCTGENVHIIGDVTFLTTSTVTDNTISGTMHSVFIATGTGLTSGLMHTTMNANGDVTSFRFERPGVSCR